MRNCALILIIASLALIPCLINAESIHTKRGFTYDNITFKAVSLTKIKISHDSGIGWLDLDELTEESLVFVKNRPEYQAVKNATDARDKAEQERRDNESEARRILKEEKKRQTIAENAKLDAELLAGKKELAQLTKKFTETILSETKAQYIHLSSKKDLWVNDFWKIKNFRAAAEDSINKDIVATEIRTLFSDDYFLQYFGTPDRELIQTVSSYRRDYSGRLKNYPYKVRMLVYNNRLTNPTTGKKEDMSVEFHDGFYKRVEALQSGNTSR